MVLLKNIYKEDHMYLNTFLSMFGLDPDNFVNELVEPMESDDGTIIYNLRQRTDKRMCPNCHNSNVIIHNYFYTETRFTPNKGMQTLLRIKKVRFECKDCNKTFTFPILGIERYAKIGRRIKELMIKDFYSQKSFSIIANDYQMSVAQVMGIFDQTFPNIAKYKLPRALCIDEIGFKSIDGSYAAIIYDHDQKIVTDVIRNRQNEYLRCYFSEYSLYERQQVKYFISDLYEGFGTIKEEFFPNAYHIADMFHVIRLLRTEVSRLRVMTYKQYTEEGDIRRNFMKQHWEAFEKYLDTKLYYKPYYSKKENIEYTTWAMIKRCLELNHTFWTAYYNLQELLEYTRWKTFDEAILGIKKISKSLADSENENLVRVSETYWKWRVEIANAITVKNIDGKRFSNGPAEGLNNAIKTLIKDANGYRNFERFRKRVLLILRNGKGPRT